MTWCVGGLVKFNKLEIWRFGALVKFRNMESLRLGVLVGWWVGEIQ